MKEGVGRGSGCDQATSDDGMTGCVVVEAYWGDSDSPEDQAIRYLVACV